jgi:phospholipid transport system substrate-binding protein
MNSQTTKKNSYLSLVILLALMLPVGVVSAEPLAPPQVVIQDISDKLQKAIKTGRKSMSYAYDLANNIVAPHVDFQRVSSLTLGKHWKRAKPAQQREFIREFKRMLVRTYAAAFFATKEWEIRHVSVRPGKSKQDVFVRTKILRPGAKPAVVEYRMYQNGSGGWKIYNLKVEGVSLVTNYRTSFQREIRNGGLDGLIKSMKSKNDTRTAAL